MSRVLTTFRRVEEDGIPFASFRFNIVEDARNDAVARWREAHTFVLTVENQSERAGSFYVHARQEPIVSVLLGPGERRQVLVHTRRPRWDEVEQARLLGYFQTDVLEEWFELPDDTRAGFVAVSLRQGDVELLFGPTMMAVFGDMGVEGRSRV